MEQDRENFFRHSTLVVDTTKEAFCDLLAYKLKQKEQTLKQFIEENQHDIYHSCYNRSPCCQCPPDSQPLCDKVFRPHQLDLLLDKSGSKLTGHRQGHQSTPHCCCPVNPDITLKMLDITLLRLLLLIFTDIGSSERDAVEDLNKIRNQSYAHASKGCMPTKEFEKSVSAIQKSLSVLAKVSGNETSTIQKVQEVLRQPISSSLFNQLQTTLLQEAKLCDKIHETVKTVCT